MSTADEIIDAIVAAYRAEAAKDSDESYGDIKYDNMPPPDEKDYEDIIHETLTAKLVTLRPGEAVRTCEDFRHLGVECCESCHSIYQHYELDLISLEGGGQAWICCALSRALNPVRHREFVNSPEYREIVSLFASDVDVQSSQDHK